MSEPIVFISHFRIKADNLDGLRHIAEKVATQLEVEKPRTLVFLDYLAADATRATFVHVFANAESLDLHFEGADERSKVALEYLEPEGWEIYGRPSQPVLEAMRKQAASSGVALRVEPEYVAGFLRLGPG